MHAKMQLVKKPKNKVLPMYISNAVLLKFLFIKNTRQNVSISSENNKQRNCFKTEEMFLEHQIST